MPSRRASRARATGRASAATAGRILAELASARRRYGPGAADTKLRLLEQLGNLELRSARDLGRAHEHALYLAAFPDDARVLRAARAHLATTGERLTRLPRRMRAKLDDSGLAGTRSRHSYDASIATWLGARYPGQAEIDWPALRDPGRLEALLRLVLLRAEEDGFDSSDVGTADWLRSAAGDSGTALAWLLQSLRHGPGTSRAWGALYTDAELPVVWTLGTGPGSVSGARLRSARVVFRRGMRPTPPDPVAHVATPLPGIRQLDRRAARQVIDLARIALTARCREAYVVNHANAGEVYLADLGEGAAVAVIGADVAHRPPLETNFGFLLLANGVPIGYGGVSPLHRQANTGINVFPAFRGSEAGYLWAQALRAFRTLFGVQRFIINPYQLGAGNSEAIASGAFWFYYRLGFRPVSRALRDLAAREASRLRGQRHHAGERATLRRLAQEDVELLIPGGERAARFEERWLPRVGLASTAALVDVARTPRAVAAFVQQVARLVGAGNPRAWTANERAGAATLAPVLALIEDLGSWPKAERRALGRLLRLKGAPREADFVRVAAGAHRLFAALAAICRGHQGR
jgi:hypothetical protein